MENRNVYALSCVILIIGLILGMFLVYNHNCPEEQKLYPTACIQTTQIINNTCICEEVPEQDCINEISIYLKQAEKDKRILRGMLE